MVKSRLDEIIGIKYDNNKPSMSLIDPSFLVGLATVLDHGKEKYGAHNWRNGINVSRLISSAYRHLGKVNEGEDLDDASGLEHVLHLACNAMFIYWTLKNRPEFDDRYRKETDERTKSMSDTGGCGCSCAKPNNPQTDSANSFFING